jgi:hypothetical protein
MHCVTQDNLNGTARFRAMGVHLALGGDLSSLNVNPAGSAIFNNNEVTITLSNNDIKNNSNYFGTATTEKVIRHKSSRRRICFQIKIKQIGESSL